MTDVSKDRLIILDDYLQERGPTLNYDKLKVISLPYDELFTNKKYEWFLNLSEEQYNDSRFFIQKFLH